MICSAFLEDIRTRVEDLIRRARLEQQTLTTEQLNWSPGGDIWSVGQIFDHLNRSVNLYLPVMRDSLDKAPSDSKGSEVKHTIIGAAIARAAGPGGKAPVPPGMNPSSGPFTMEVIEEFLTLHGRVLDMIAEADGADLSRSKVPNPMIKLLKMNLADCFAILAGHGERHLGQISDLERRPDFPSR